MQIMTDQFFGPHAPHMQEDPRPASPVTAEVAIYVFIISTALALIWWVS